MGQDAAGNDWETEGTQAATEEDTIYGSTGSDGTLSSLFGPAAPAVALAASPMSASPPTESGNWIHEEPALANCFQNHAAGFNYARATLDLSKESLWEWSREHRVPLFERLSPEGPEFVKVGRSELCEATMNWRLVPDIQDELEDLPTLRNFVCHPEPKQRLADYESYAAIAERLMVRLGDHERVQRLRAMRDGLRVYAEQKLNEIAGRQVWAELGGSFAHDDGTWDRDHTELFKRVKDSESRSRNAREFPEVVKEVAETWAEVNIYSKSRGEERICWPEI